MASEAEEAFLRAWKKSNCHAIQWIREYRFHPRRRFRFDFAIPELLIAVEIEGWGRHQSHRGYASDCTKYNLATALGWRVFRFPAILLNKKDQWGDSLLEQFVENLCRFICGLSVGEGDHDAWSH